MTYEQQQAYKDQVNFVVSGGAAAALACCAVVSTTGQQQNHAVGGPSDLSLAGGAPSGPPFCLHLLPTSAAQHLPTLHRSPLRVAAPQALNVENTKWAPEVLEYGVKGIPEVGACWC